MQRLASVSVFAILNIAFAVMGILVTMGAAAHVSGGAGNVDNPYLNASQNSAVFADWLKLTTILGLIVSVVLFVAGVGLMKVLPWARTVSIGYGIYQIIIVLVGVIMNFIFLLQPMMAQANQEQGPQAAATVGKAIAATFGGCLQFIYPCLLIIFMMRPNVMAAFKVRTAASTSNKKPAKNATGDVP
jgi:hypothetical protein